MADRTSSATEGETPAKDGTRLRYELHGDGQESGRIVLVHSLAMDASFWHPIAAELAGTAQVLLLDCRGHGRSDKPAGPYTVELFAGDVATVMDAVGWDKAVIAGASMGGCVTLVVGARHPERAAGLGLIDTTAWYGPTAPQDWEGRAQKAKADGLASMTDFQVTRWFSDGFRRDNPEVVRDAVNVFLRNDLQAYMETCRMLGACDLRAALPGFSFPVRIVVGDEDYAAPVAMAKAMHEAIPGSTLEVLPGVRHLTPLEVPGVIASRLARLLAEAGHA